MIETFLRKELDRIEKEGLTRRLREQKGVQDRKIEIDGVRVLNFCSNNYLGLANDSRLGQAALECLQKEGWGSGASRLICGNMNTHVALEKKIAAFKGTEDCLLFSTGYMANVGIISSVFDRHDVIFSDRLNHASIIDGIQLSGAKMKRYPHGDMDALERVLQKTECTGKKAIVTDSIFSMDGDFAPLDKIVDLAKRYNCLTMIDEAHALGVIGKNGKGLAEYFGVENEIDVQMGTLSKAAGSFGAYCCGTKELIEFLINKARSFIYTTGMPPSIAAASLKAIEIIQKEPHLRERLWDNARYMRAQINLIGFETLSSEIPIIPIMVKDSGVAVEFSKKLLEKGIFVTAIRPPTVPDNTARLRLTIMASHDKADLDFAVNKLQEVGKELKLI